MRISPHEPSAGTSPTVPESEGRLPWWVRASTAPLNVRLGAIALLIGGYLVAYHLMSSSERVALRPINLLILVIAGALFGTRGGVGVGVGLSLVNIGLYLRDGLFGDTATRMAGNLLSVIAGVFAGAVLGKARDLSLTLRAEVLRRQLAERQKSELSELLVHDFKNPLAAIIGHASLLQQDELTPADVKDSSEAICVSAERLRRMVHNLLDIGRAEDGQLRPTLTSVDLNLLADEVRSLLERQIRDRRQTFELRPARQGSMVVADVELLRRILINLVDNASKYTPWDRTIRVGIEPDGDSVVVAVSDEGPGIPAGYEEKIFEKYVRVDGATNEVAHASRGLGLAFCRLATQVHDGRIWVEPGVPTGSVFRVRLPRSGPRLPSVEAQG